MRKGASWLWFCPICRPC
ncbi:unnamed protein product, partial [Vitis vinifera]